MKYFHLTLLPAFSMAQIDSIVQQGLLLQDYGYNLLSSVMQSLGYDNNEADDVVKHGCWCGKLNPNLNPDYQKFLGGPDFVDELDQICKEWFSIRNCNDKLPGGSCNDGTGLMTREYLSTAEYTLFVDRTGNMDDSYCSNTITDACSADTCTIDRFYVSKIIGWLANPNYDLHYDLVEVTNNSQCYASNVPSGGSTGAGSTGTGNTGTGSTGTGSTGTGSTGTAPPQTCTGTAPYLTIVPKTPEQIAEEQAEAEQAALVADGWVPTENTNPNLVTAPGVVAVDAACKETGAPATRAVFKLFSDDHHQLYFDDATWSEAKDRCAAKRDGATLATIHSAEEHALIYSKVFGTTYSAWIGGNDKDNEGSWKWVSGRNGVAESMCYDNWEHDEPNDITFGGEDCAMMLYANNGKWYDVPCNNPLTHYICEVRWPTTVVPKTLEQVADEQDGEEQKALLANGWSAVDTSRYALAPSCYAMTTRAVFKLFNESGDWYNARDKCAALGNGASLAAIYSAEEAALVQSLGADVSAWVGGHDEKTEGYWEWLVGRTLFAEPVCYNNWENGEPNSSIGDEDCIEKNTNGKWNAIPCATIKEAYICQIRWHDSRFDWVQW